MPRTGKQVLPSSREHLSISGFGALLYTKSNFILSKHYIQELLKFATDILKKSNQNKTSGIQIKMTYVIALL